MEQTEEAQERARRKEMERKMREDSILMGVRTVQSILTRYARIEDPVVRFSLILDKFILGTDIGAAALRVFGMSEEISEGTKKEIEVCQKTVQEEMMALMDWIQNPVYGPDHPIGKRMMEQGKRSYAETSEKKEL